MTARAYALTADENGCLQAAAAGYEASLVSDPGDLEATVNLVVLYWRASGRQRSDDGPAQPGRPLPPAFRAYAKQRLWELLESAGHRFSDRAEIQFWSRYIAAQDAGRPLAPAECRELLRERPDYLEPAFVVFSNSAGGEAESEAMRLLVGCSEQPTTRGRYVSSIITTVLRMRHWNTDCELTV